MRSLLKPLVRSINKKYMRNLYFGLADDSTTLKKIDLNELKQEHNLEKAELTSNEKSENHESESATDEKNDLFYDI